MIKLIFTSAFLSFCFVSFSQWNLVWSDEFSGNSLDATKWSHELGGGGWGNNESQFYTSNANNLEVSNDLLKITALQQTIGSYPYTSARIFTKGKYVVQYGKIEARIKVPLGQGIWPAFWMLGSNFDVVSWPFCGEIDIMEHINNEQMIHGTAHWSDGGHAYYGNSVNLDPTVFHIYSIEWNQNTIRWFVDGVQFHIMNISNGINGTSEFHAPFFIILNMAVGGNWPGYPNATTTFPQVLLVDYVRVYKDQSDLSLSTIEMNSISVAPNPAKNLLRVDGLELGQAAIIKSMDGKVCLTISDVQNQEFDISSLTSGTYLLEIENENGVISRAKFIKQ